MSNIARSLLSIFLLLRALYFLPLIIASRRRQPRRRRSSPSIFCSAGQSWGDHRFCLVVDRQRASSSSALVLQKSAQLVTGHLPAPARAMDGLGRRRALLCPSSSSPRPLHEAARRNSRIAQHNRADPQHREERDEPLTADRAAARQTNRATEGW